MREYLQFLCGVITGYRENRFPGHDEKKLDTKAL